jgi:sortase A
MSKKKVRITLRQFNHGLSVVVILLCAYVIVTPFLPNLFYKVQPMPPLAQAEQEGKRPPAPEKNTLVIPRLKMQQTIYENGVAQWGLSKGVWRDPSTSSPDLGKNTVLSGHRFTYAGKAVFYHLDKLKEDDKIVVYWNKQRHEYVVRRILTLPPTAGEYTKSTKKPRLTIYTCTPLFTAEHRLMIIAEPVEEDQP